MQNKFEPTSEEVRAAFEDLSKATPDHYATLDLDAFLLGYSMAKGMKAVDAVPFVKANSVKEDGK